MIGYVTETNEVVKVLPTGQWYLNVNNVLFIECKTIRSILQKLYIPKYKWLHENNIIWINECSNGIDSLQEGS